MIAPWLVSRYKCRLGLIFDCNLMVLSIKQHVGHIEGLYTLGSTRIGSVLSDANCELNVVDKISGVECRQY